MAERVAPRHAYPDRQSGGLDEAARDTRGTSVTFRIVERADEDLLADLFTEIDTTFFRPHPFTRAEAHRIAVSRRGDVYAILVDRERAIAYGMLRGLSEGYPIPTLGIGVRSSERGRGIGRAMMHELHAQARRRGLTVVRLRVHAENTAARRLYESLGYRYAGVDRGELLMLLDLGATPTDSAAPAPTLVGRLIAVDDPAWSAVLSETRHDFYHLPSYTALSAAERGGRPAALHISDGQRACLLPIVLRDFHGTRDAISPYGYPGPLATDRDPGFLRLALATGRQVLRNERVVSAFIRLHPLINTPTVAGLGTVVEHGDTVSLDLASSAEVLWSRMRTNHRRDVARARRDGWAARADTRWEQFDEFKRLYRLTMDRRLAADQYYFDDAYFEQLREALGDSLRLWVVEREGRIAAAGLFVRTGDIVEYHLSGTDPTAPCVQPTKLMIHEVAVDARARGSRIMLLGGGLGARSDSLLHFKLGFSPDRHPFTTLRMVIDWEAYRRLVKAFGPDHDASDTEGFFPLYRAPAAST